MTWKMNLCSLPHEPMFPTQWTYVHRHINLCSWKGPENRERKRAVFLQGIARKGSLTWQKHPICDRFRAFFLGCLKKKKYLCGRIKMIWIKLLVSAKSWRAINHVSALPIKRHCGFILQKVSPIHSSYPLFLADSRSWKWNKAQYLTCSPQSLAVKSFQKRTILPYIESF